MPQMADIIIRNARIRTMDPDAPRAEALAIYGNRILAVGSDAEIGGLAGSRTKVIDADGASVLPGFNEAHMHIFQGSVSLDLLNLMGVSGFDALQDAIRTYAAQKPDETLLMATMASYIVLSETEPVTRHHLDRILPDRPFIMIAPDHHTAWANTAALKLGGLFQGRDVGIGNEVVMGDDGFANGELRETNAISPIASLTATGGRESLGIATGADPENLTPEQRAADIAVIKRGLAYCASMGITSVQNFDGNLYQLEIMAELERSGDLPVRMRIPFHMKNFMDLSMLDEAVRRKERFASDRLRGDFVKVFMDGVLDSQTAFVIDGYGNRPDYDCEPLFTLEHFKEIAIKADALSLQIAVHAIGDGAVRLTLDGYEAAVVSNGKRDSRHRIEHIEMLHPDDINRFAELGTVASMQPVHAPETHGVAREPTLSNIGEHRWQYAFAWKTLKDAGARMVFATDWPVSPLNPIDCIHEALNRPLWRDDLPDQRLTLDETLAAYTSEGAWVEFMEDRKGMLKPGYLADLVVLSGDLDAAGAANFKSLKTLVTICDGQITHGSV